MQVKTLFMNTTAKIIIGFIIGAALGSVTGLLMAPTSGKTARKNLNKKAKKLVKQMESAFGKQPVAKGRRKTTQTGAHLKNGKAQVAY
jgi:gas vesicle protein